MNPFYFGSARNRLFGVYHPPGTRPHRHRAVVLCAPAFGEYLQCHRALRQLAILLARRGFPTLRFDYYAPGDSGGDAREASLGRWQDDIAVAVEEALALGTAESVTVVGLRLGATIGCIVGCGHPDVTEVALWDPVVTGAEYLEYLAEQHNGAGTVDASADGDEVLGFPISAPLRRQIAQLRLSGTDVSSLRRVLLLHNLEYEAYAELERRWAAHGTELRRAYIPGSPVWMHDVANSSELVPMRALDVVAGWIDGSEDVLP